jgi:hypothetical protein
MEIRSVNEFHPAPASFASEPESTHVIPNEALAARSPSPKRLLPESLWMEDASPGSRKFAAPSGADIAHKRRAGRQRTSVAIFPDPAVFPISMAGSLLVSSLSKINFGGEPWIADRFSVQV